MNPYTASATLAIRILAMVILAVSAWQLCANLALSWREFDPNYFAYYLQSQVLRPGIGVIIALLLFFWSSFLGRRLAGELGRTK